MKISLGRFIAYAVVALVVCDIVFWCVRDRNLVLAATLSIVVNFGFVLLAVMFPCLCIWKIAVKTNTHPRWMAWIPGLNLLVVCRIGRVSGWWAFLTLGALLIAENGSDSWAVLLVFPFWFGVAVLLYQLPKALGVQESSKFLIIVPVVNYFYMGYMAFRTEKPPSEAPPSTMSNKPEAPQAASIANHHDDALPISESEIQSTPPLPISETKEPSNARTEVMSMNRNQRFVVALAAALFALAMFFPPWVYTYDRNGTYGAHTTKPAGFSCILSPPAPEQHGANYGVHMDLPRLSVECLFILALGGAAWFWIGRDSGSEPSQHSVQPETVTSQPAHFWPSSFEQWLFIGGLALVVAVLTGIAVGELIKSSRKALVSHNPRLADAPPKIIEFEEETNAPPASPGFKKFTPPRPDALVKDAPILAILEPESYVASSGHWIDGVMDDGNFIKLEDGSLWKVSPIDAIDSALWLPVTDITVIDSDDPAYPYKLVNKDDNEVVNARLIDQ